MSFDPHQPDQLARYSRQLVLRAVGSRGQAALGAARVLVVGAGGLGAPVLTYLAAAGVGSLTVADPDLVELSNLNRQVLFDEGTVGEPKAIATARRLAAQNPHLTVRPLVLEVDASNVEALIAEVDVVVDASDNFPTRFLLNDACWLAGKPLVHGGIYHFTGQVTTFIPGAGPCYRCFFPEPPASGTVPNCQEAGVLGPIAGLVGSMQAQETLKLLLGAPAQTLAGRLLLIDLWENHFDSIQLAPAPDCPLCGPEPTLTTIT
jgi:molybdopterin/thiamine biosynthesis adenylyltransferase